MADEEVKEESEKEEGETILDKEEEKKFNLSVGTIQILKTVLQYLIIVIMVIGISYCVSSNIASKTSSLAENRDLTALDPPTGEIFVRRPSGLDWSMKEMRVNTADEDEPHLVIAVIVVSYEEGNTKLQLELEKRRTEIRSEVRNIIGSKKYSEINTTLEQGYLRKEIKERLQIIVGIPGIIEIYLNDFTVH